MTHTEILPEIFKLDPRDQLMIAAAIRDHLLDEASPVEESDFKAELEQRLAQADAYPDDEASLDEVITRLKAKR